MKGGHTEVVRALLKKYADLDVEGIVSTLYLKSVLFLQKKQLLSKFYS